MARSFHDMPEFRRAEWLAWAKSHDWGGGEPCFTENMETGEIGLHVECAAKDESGEWYVESYLAMTPSDLRAWAGY